jgi:hypothetical protein
MSAIVKANNRLATGGLAVIKRSFTADKDNKVTYTAEYVCLAQFADANAQRFRKNSQPPTPIPASMQRLGIVEVPKLYDVTSETLNGLTYFRATYVAVGDSNSSFSVTRSSDQRSFQGSQTKTITTGPTGFLTENVVTDTLTFDYISITATASSTNQNLPGVSGGVGGKFNERRTRTFATGGGTVAGGSVNVGTARVTSSSQTRNSDGTFTFTRTSSGIYVQK